LVKIFKAQDVVNCIADNTSVAVSLNDLSYKPTDDALLINVKKEADHILEKAMMEAEYMIAQAKRDALNVIEEATEAATGLLEEARFNGYNQGIADCEEKVSKRYLEVENQASKIISDALNERENILMGLTDEILALSLNISEKIIRTELGSNKDAFKLMVLSAVSKVAGTNNAKVRVSEADYENYFSNNRGDAFAEDNVLNISFIKDRNLKLGDCVIDTEGGTIDASLDTQMKQVKLAFGVK
jgi:flagellar assembly protein FliH